MFIVSGEFISSSSSRSFILLQLQTQFNLAPRFARRQNGMGSRKSRPARVQCHEEGRKKGRKRPGTRQTLVPLSASQLSAKNYLLGLCHGRKSRARSGEKGIPFLLFSPLASSLSLSLVRASAYWASLLLLSSSESTQASLIIVPM